MMIREMIERLEKKYGEPTPGPAKDPLSELIFTILSQNTSDVNRDRAFSRLRQKFPTWELMRRARTSSIASAIKVGGLANIKAARLKGLLSEIVRRYGKLSLEFLRQKDVQQIRQTLLSFKGVGVKTAACVILFSLRKPAFPVDTHVFRVAKRLGLIPRRATPEAAHSLMEELVPPEKYFSFHINLIRLGRRVCHPRNPRCFECPLGDLCPSHPMRSGGDQGS